MNIDAIKREVLEAIARIDRNLETWRIRFEKNPVDALEWGDSAYEAAADWQVANFVYHYITYPRDDGKQPSKEELRNAMTKEFHRRAGKIGGSTNASHNMIEKFVVQAYSKFLDPQAFGFGLTLEKLFRNQ